MVDVEARTRLLKKRIEALSFDDDIIARARTIVEDAGLNIPDAVEMLRKEWLTDMVITTNAQHFRTAKRNPGDHFLEWLAVRARNPFHVTHRAVDNVATRLGPEVAARIAHIIWPQEISWAQRLRLSENPILATKSAMFLREAMGNPAKMFDKIADLYSESYAKIEYSDHPVQDLSPVEIRFADDVPEFNPLFLRHASRSYSELISSMPRDKIEILAARAAKDEQGERAKISAAKVVDHTKRFPMRQMLNVISFAHSAGINANDLHKLERVFLTMLLRGEIELDQGFLSAHTQFITLISSPERRENLLFTADLGDFDPDNTIWQIAHLDRRWIDTLPQSYQKWNAKLAPEMLNWQIEVVEERRETPADPISDFGFWLIEREFTS